MFFVSIFLPSFHNKKVPFLLSETFVYRRSLKEFSDFMPVTSTLECLSIINNCLKRRGGTYISIICYAALGAGLPRSVALLTGGTGSLSKRITWYSAVILWAVGIKGGPTLCIVQCDVLWDPAPCHLLITFHGWETRRRPPGEAAQTRILSGLGVTS